MYSLRELGTVSWALRRLRPDLYHATHYVLPAHLPCPAVVTIHDIIHLLFPQFLKNRLALLYARLMIGRSLRVGRRIITVSQSTRDDVQDFFGVDGARPARGLQRRRRGVPARAPRRRDPGQAAALPACAAPTCSSSATRSRTRTSRTCCGPTRARSSSRPATPRSPASAIATASRLACATSADRWGSPSASPSSATCPTTTYRRSTRARSPSSIPASTRASACR